ncbi:uncharacterized protein K452DRAFT_104075 [Aplosporella prunicola CBS 121167]|uniref:Heterokaryon incompatibility domain-containing protein n=1 Tax=Aplosporella prunicola CBS 121167 TaxID=1176127 RepID=A0A6A6BRQ4_9PEZI|nr:uncharacterized protein K452DRAFT_104075 [Aplosporella prunicola CBS 121167]KAF2145965.1 hypothetical protein K452DRAFT_104075 [Aplosporella prunicola CBS 121167]
MQNNYIGGGLCQSCVKVGLAAHIKTLLMRKHTLSHWKLSVMRSPSWNSLVMGSVRSIKTGGECSFCDLIRHLLSPDVDRYSGNESTIQVLFQMDEANKEVSLLKAKTKAPVLFLGTITRCDGSIAALGNGRADQSPEYDSEELEYDASLRIQKIRDVLVTCEAEHNHGTAEQDQGRRVPVDMLFIDVKQENLVRVSSKQRYFALSYVWGTTSMFQTKMANIHILQEPGSLRRHWQQLSQVIKDAILLVQMLGGQYLWVDSLCIEQDNPVQKQGQIAQMDLIYSHALLTLVAWSAEDATSSLPGVRLNTSRSPLLIRSIFGPLYKATPFDLMLDRYSNRWPVIVPKYNTRAWTFQERLLSPRCLFFTYYDAIFVCDSEFSIGINSNIKTKDPDFVSFRSPHLANQLALREMKPERALFIYEHLVSHYTKLQASRDTDTLNAFSGILTTLRPIMGNFLQGTPLRCFGSALLWKPSSIEHNLERNKNFSSWSWAGWLGQTCYDSRKCIINLLQEVNVSYQTPERSLVLNEYEKFPGDSANLGPQSDLSELQMGVDIISFFADSVPSNTFCVNSFAGTNFVRVVDRRGFWCGALFFNQLCQFDDGSELSLVQGNCQLVLLSRQLAHNDRSLYDPKLVPKPWWFLNIILVCWKGAHAERLAVGTIH